MNPARRTLRRVLAVAAMTGTTILVPTVALAASGHPAAAARAAAPARLTAVAPRCLVAGLTGWLGVPSSGYAGGSYLELELSNISNQACTLYGYPGVSALGPGGRQLGSAAARSSADPTRLVTLSRGETAHVVLQIVDVGGFPAAACKPGGAVALRVYPPNDFRALTIPYSFSACTKAGPVFLSVRTTVSGTGIPNFSF